MSPVRDAQLQLGAEPDLFLGGRSADQFAAHHLVHVGFITATTLGCSARGRGLTRGTPSAGRLRPRRLTHPMVSLRIEQPGEGYTSA
jgi:hypothetical protein